MDPFGLFGKFTVIEGERDQLAHILLQAAESMKDIEGCEIYLVSTSDNDPNAVFVYEEWSSEHAHQASLNHDATRMLIQRAKPLITGMERISTLKPIGGKGSRTRSK